ncbi:MAG: response regulator transcription factor [Actinomycetales bacterium]|nr:response regulator transcription factor [Actinomycetales bacterium]
MPEEGHRPLRLVLVDDHEMVLHGLLAMLAHFASDVEVVATATSLERARREIATAQPDIVLSDVRLGRDSGLDLVRELARTQPDVKVVMLTVYDDEHYLFQALRAGAQGYILKRVDAAELVGHLRRVAEGEVAIDPALAGRVALSAARISAGEFWPGANLGLTQRESEVLDLLVAGHSNRSVAATLVVSEDTVKTHIRSLYRKLDVQDRAGAIAVALREGLFR